MKEHNYETHLQKAEVTWIVEVKPISDLELNLPNLIELKVTFTNKDNSVHWEVQNAKDKADSIIPAMKERIIEECLRRGIFTVLRR